MNVTLIACFFLFDSMICWPDDRAYRILMKGRELLMAYRKLSCAELMSYVVVLLLFSKTTMF